MSENTRERAPSTPGKEPSGPFEGRQRWITIAWVAVALLLATVIQGPMTRGPQDIPLSRLLTLVERDQVERVNLAEGSASGTFVDREGQEREFTTTLPTAANYDVNELVQELRARDVTITATQPNPLIGLLFWIIPFALIVGLYVFLMRRMRGQFMGGAGGPMQLGKNKAKLYDRTDLKTTFADVAGVNEVEVELQELVAYLKDADKSRRIGAKIPKGVLLVGPPGTGKTLLARAIAGEAQVPFFFISASEFIELFVGLGAARVRDLFQQARERAPAIVFIDEIDSIGQARSAGGGPQMTGNQEQEQTLQQLLTEMDGFEPNSGVIIVAASNRPEVLDQALLRPGRFDRQIVVNLPDIRGREEILQIHARGVAMADDVDLITLARRTPGFSGAQLANVINEGALLAARKDKTSVEMQDFDEAIDRLIAGLEKKRVMSTKEREIVAYHESGHAIVATVLPGLDPVHKISIVQRGFGALGYTMQLPLEDRYLMTRTDLLSQLSVLLGGRSAEEIAFNEISTGAQNDLQRATDIARSMVTEFGMSDALGAVNYDGHRRATFIDNPFAHERGNYAEETALKIDAEVKRILTEAHQKARDILTEYRSVLDTLSHRLLAKEVIEAEELKAIMAEMGPVPPKDPNAVPAEVPPIG